MIRPPWFVGDQQQRRRRRPAPSRRPSLLRRSVVRRRATPTTPSTTKPRPSAIDPGNVPLPHSPGRSLAWLNSTQSPSPVNPAPSVGERDEHAVAGGDCAAIVRAVWGRAVGRRHEDRQVQGDHQQVRPVPLVLGVRDGQPDAGAHRHAEHRGAAHEPARDQQHHQHRLADQRDPAEHRQVRRRHVLEEPRRARCAPGTPRRPRRSDTARSSGRRCGRSPAAPSSSRWPATTARRSTAGSWVPTVGSRRRPLR